MGQKQCSIPASDPAYDDLKKIEKRWVIANKLQVGRRKDDGKLVSCSPLMVQKGDFVDVSVVADIASYGGENSANTRVHFRLEQVLQVTAARPVRVSDI